VGRWNGVDDILGGGDWVVFIVGRWNRSVDIIGRGG
jgi:hypothetical protein